MLRLRLLGVLNPHATEVIRILIGFTAALVLSSGVVDAQTECGDLEGCVKELQSDDSSVRAAAISILGSLRDSQAIPHLVKVVEEDQDTFVARSAVRALGVIGDAAAAKTLGEIVRTEPHLQDEAVRALVRIGGKPANDAFIKVLNDPMAQMSALQGLAEAGDRSAKPHLLDLYRSTKDERVRGMAGIAFQRIRSRLGPTEDEMGVPLYPGSRYFPNALAEWIFTTRDPVGQVIEFYQDKLERPPLDFEAFKEAHERGFQSTEETIEGVPIDKPDMIFVIEEQSFEGGTYPSKMIFIKSSLKKTRIKIYHAVDG